jgi:hypothetical protein
VAGARRETIPGRADDTLVAGGDGTEAARELMDGTRPVSLDRPPEKDTMLMTTSPLDDIVRLSRSGPRLA